MISVDEALDKIRNNRPAHEIEAVPLNLAHNRILSSDVIAKLDRPPLPVSAMDGYAVRLEDVSSGNWTLSVIGEAPAGTPFKGKISKGEAVRIFTGAALPDGADHVVIQEDCTASGSNISSSNSYKRSQYVRQKGIDFSADQTIHRSGRCLSAIDLSLAADANIETIKSYRPLKIALIANGEELKPVGSSLAPGEIINSNPIGLSALIDKWGGQSIDLGIAGDSVQSIQKKIEDAPRDIDIFVAIGGASVGDHDHMRTAFYEAGFSQIFEKIAVKPGKPTWFAKKEHQLVLGLPGNPASALVCAHLFLQTLVKPVFHHKFGPGILANDLKQNGGREAYLRGSAKLDQHGQVMIEPADNQDSSLLCVFARSNCLIRRKPNAPKTQAGNIVEFLLLGDLVMD